MADELTPVEGVGPLHNARACSTCHFAPAIDAFEATNTNVTQFGIERYGRFYQWACPTAAATASLR